MKNKNVILQGILIVVLFGMIIVGLSLAWFQSATVNRINDFSIEVGSADTFELSLDGINYNRQLNIRLFDKSTTINGDIFDSSLQLADITSVYEEQTSVGNKTYKSLKLCSPTRDDYDGTPILNTTTEWSEAIKSKVLYNLSDGNYYVVSSDDEAIAQYIELDLWIRSDSNLEIYLGDESKISPVTTSNDANVIPAMYSVEQELKAYSCTRYFNASDITIPYFSILTMGPDTYYFKDTVNSEDNTIIDHEFAVRTRTINVNGVDYTYYYDENDDFLIKSRVVDEYTEFYNSASQFKFKTKYVTVGSYDSIKYYDSVSVEITSEETIDLLVNNSNLATFFSLYSPDSVALNHSTTNQTEKKEVCYYNEKGDFLIRKVVEGNTTTYYDNENPNVSGNVVDLAGKEYQVISPSVYGIKRNTAMGGVAVTSILTQTFSKNLSAGAALVSFSELVTDTFLVESEERTLEVEDVKYVWNPLPYYHLSSTPGTVESEFSIDNNPQTINYYVYDSVNHVYTLESWPINDNSDLVKLGNIQTNEFEVLGEENPLCTTTVESSSKFCIKKLRIKLWIDGNNELSQNSMLNSSATANGKINVALKLVSNVNRTIITQKDVLGNGVYTLEASKINGLEEVYEWSVSDTFWSYSPEYVFKIADVVADTNDSSKATLTFVRNGTVTVYARDSKGRVGTIVISYDYGRIVCSHVEGSNEYQLYCVEVDSADDSIKLSGIWNISNNILAGIDYDDTTKIATITFNDSGSLRVLAKLSIEVQVNDIVVTYDVEVAYDIVHTYVEDGD